jgi:CheY-like chemotaxis protein
VATTILVVEDEDSIRLTLRDYLKKEGYEVLVASEGVGAIKQMLDNNPVDIIVTDYRMNLFGGNYWMRFLTRFCPGQKVILTSGFVTPGTDLPFPILYKPYDYADLVRLIEDTLRSHPTGG